MIQNLKTTIVSFSADEVHEILTASAKAQVSVTQKDGAFVKNVDRSRISYHIDGDTDNLTHVVISLEEIVA